MTALLDTLDRFNHTSSSIQSLTRSQLPTSDPGPFTAAMLQLSPQDLLRDADEAEYGLFTFVRDSSDIPLEGIATQGKVGRKEFRGATPLRPKRVAGMLPDEEPEVYVEAALKYLDRFHAVKPMPHVRSQLETLIGRLNNVRDNIERLQMSLEQSAQDRHPSPKSQEAEEERRIGELKSRILQLRKRKEALVLKLPTKSKTQPREAKGVRAEKSSMKVGHPRRSFDDSSSTLSTSISPTKNKPKFGTLPPTQHRQRMARPSKIKTTSEEEPSSRIPEGVDQDERLVWSEDRSPRIGLGDPGQSSSLLDEKLDISSGFDPLMSPTPPSQSLSSSSKSLVESAAGLQGGPTHRTNPVDVHTKDEEGEYSDSGEPTVVVSKLPAPRTIVAPATTPPSPPPSRPPSQSSKSELQTPVQDGKVAAAPPSEKTKVKRVRVTTEVERVCAKIWSTIPDLLVPGNNFSSAGKKPPNARDTLAVLQTISAQPIPGPTLDPVSSPSTRSTLSSLLGIETLGPAGVSPHQIMTAHLLLSLLTMPNHAMPLMALKALLASKTTIPSPGPEAGREAKQAAAALGASMAQAGTRALYGCVAKKLVKIDRGGGEQVVMFD